MNIEIITKVGNINMYGIHLRMIFTPKSSVLSKKYWLKNRLADSQPIIVIE